MKITNKTLMVDFETEVKLGKNDAIELTLKHQAFIYEGKKGKIVDLDLGVDVFDIKFLGLDIDSSFNGYRQFEKQLKELGIDLKELIDEKIKEMNTDELTTKLKLMFNNAV